MNQEKKPQKSKYLRSGRHLFQKNTVAQTQYSLILHRIDLKLKQMLQSQKDKGSRKWQIDQDMAPLKHQKSNKLKKRKQVVSRKFSRSYKAQKTKDQESTI